MTDVGDKRVDAKMALLERIAKDAPTGHPPYLLQLAEAYAWIEYPNNAHGSSTEVKS